MKKLLVAISLLLVVATVMAVPAFGAKAVDVDDLVWNVGQTIHKVEKETAKAPKIDGVIGKDEYTYTYKYTEPTFSSDRASYESSALRSAGILPSNEYAEWNSDSMELFVSYDAEYIYIAIRDDMFYMDKDRKNNDTQARLYLGFDINNPDKAIRLQVNGGAVDSKTNVNGVDVKYCAESKATQSGSDAAGYVNVHELKLRKSDIVKVFNNDCGTDFVECPNTFYISMIMRQYNNRTTGDRLTAMETFSVWFAKKLTNVDKLTLNNKWTNIPAIVVLGAADDEAVETTTEEETTTEPAATTEPETTIGTVTTEPETTTEPTTTPVVETTPAESETEPAPVKKGCKGSITAMGVALVAVMGMGAVVVSKKKED